MSALDLALGFLALGAFVSGYRTGIIVRVLSWLGLVLGLLLVTRNLVAIRKALSSITSVPEVLVFGAILLGGALLGKLVGYFAGKWLRHNLPGQALRKIDRLAGATFGVLGVAIVFWMVRPLMALVPGWPSQITRDSAVAQRFATALPNPPNLLRSARRALSNGVVPQVIGLNERTDAAGEPPLKSNFEIVTLEKVRRGVVKVRATACGVTSTGTGYVSDDGQVRTAAHVVAGSRSVEIIDSTQLARPATVATIDPSLDMAILSLGTANLPVLPQAPKPPALGDELAVFGFPADKSLTITSAGLRQVVTAAGRDIYDARDVNRPVMVLAAELHPGDSGGPVIDASGAVVGMAIAVAPDRKATAYAIPVTAESIRSVDAPGRCVF